MAVGAPTGLNWRQQEEESGGAVTDAGEFGMRRQIATDLVQYLVVVVPDIDSLPMMTPALAQLVETEAIRILDVVVIARQPDGSIAVLELEDVPNLEGLAGVEGEVGGLLGDQDIALVALGLRPGAVGLVVVTEDRWAETLSASARQAGGTIVAGERIPARCASRLLSPGYQGTRAARTTIASKTRPTHATVSSKRAAAPEALPPSAGSFSVTSSRKRNVNGR